MTGIRYTSIALFFCLTRSKMEEKRNEITKTEVKRETGNQRLNGRDFKNKLLPSVLVFLCISAMKGLGSDIYEGAEKVMVGLVPFMVRWCHYRWHRC